ncbi:MAG: acyltransferase [Alphaproteobacteria bacterium]|nr:acyltransferase [Alphaproteobacteria bacterium]
MIFKNIQALRAFAANSVLLTHIVSVEQKYGHGISVLDPSFHLGAMSVDLFFVISGFIMASLANATRWDKFLIDRATRIYPLYWFYTTIVLLITLIAPGLANNSFEHAPSLWRSYLLIPDTVMPLLAVGWTLIHEIYFYLVFAFILFSMRFITLPVIAWAVLWGAAIIAVNLSGLNDQTGPIVTLVTHPLTLEFILGIAVGTLIHQSNKTQLLWTICAIAIVVLTLCCSDITFINIDEKNLQHIALFGIPCALLVYAALQIELKNILVAPAWLVQLGNASFSIYLMHVLVISALGHIFVKLPFHTPPFEIAFVVLCIAAPYIAGLVSYRLIEQPMQRALRHKVRSS